MRRLAIGSISFAFAVLFASLADNSWADFAFSGALAAIGALFIILFQDHNKEAPKIILFSLAFGFLFTGIYSRATVEKAHACSGTEVPIIAEVIDLPVQYDDYAKVSVRIQAGAPELKAVLYDSSSGSDLMNYAPGDQIRLTARLKASDQKYGEDYDYYKSIGFYLNAYVKSDIEKIGSGARFPYVPVYIKAFVKTQIEKIFDDSTYPFFQSLLLGDKSNFYQDGSLSTAMSRAGIMHIVAVSGMHISFLVGFITLSFGKNKRTSLLCILIIWLFVLITGSSPSAFRAGLMQTVLLLAPFFSREEDSITSLSFALLLILLLNPFAIFSVSFQLSFSAMAGLILFSTPLLNYFSNLFPKLTDRRILSYIVNIIVSSLSVMVFTVPITLLHFSSVQLLSPLTNIFVLWAVSLAFCGGYLVLFVSLVNLKAAQVIAAAVALPAKHIIGCAKFISRFPYSSIYISAPEGNYILLWILLVYLLFLFSVLYKQGRFSRLLIPFALSAISITLVLYSSYVINRSGEGEISVLDIGQGQCISVFSGDETVLIDCGSSQTSDNAGDLAGRFLLSCGRKKVDALILTHLHSDHANGVTSLMEYISVDKIYIPQNAPDDDHLIDEIASAAASSGTEIVLLSEDTSLKLNNILNISLFLPEVEIGEEADNSSANELCQFVLADLNGFQLLVTGDSEKAQELAFIDKHPMTGIDLLIVGHHGSRTSSDEDFLSSLGCSNAVISTGYNNYGHPTSDVLTRLTRCGYQIYRTDLNGTIRFSVS